MALMPQELAQLRAFAESLADIAGAAILPHFRKPTQVRDKGGSGYNPVTEADRAAEAAMRAAIRAHFPDHGILGEEEPSAPGSSPLTWVLDPIDGTLSFLAGLPTWGTLVALNDGRRPVLGVMNQPWLKERYVGDGNGAWRDGEAIRARACARLEDAWLMCTSPRMFDTPGRRAAFETLADTALVTRYGGDCHAYCMLASGYVDVVVEAGLEPFDVQALIPIVEGAGGRMTAWDGGDAQHGGAVLACGDARLHAQLVERLAPHARAPG